MAFNSAPRSNAAAPANDAWKAQAFLNMFITRTDGSKVKVGAIPLKTSKKFENALIERLKQEGGLQAFADAVAFDFQLVDDTAKADVGF